MSRSLRLLSIALIALIGLNRFAIADTCDGLKNCRDYADPSTGASSAVYSKHKLALVVGTNKYYSDVTPRNPGDLENAVNDARLIGTTLSDLDYNVRYVFNPDRKEILSELRKLSSYVTDIEIEINPDDIEEEDWPRILVYFAGHGVSDLGTDKLVFPIKSKDRDSERNLLLETHDVASQFFGLDYFEATFVFDACRSEIRLPALKNNGKTRGTVGFGQEKLNRVSKYLTAYSTTNGSIAADEMEGVNQGPYAYFLSLFMEAPGMEAQDVFTQTSYYVGRYSLQKPKTIFDQGPSVAARAYRPAEVTDQCGPALIGFVDKTKTGWCQTDGPDGISDRCAMNIAKHLISSGSGILNMCPKLNSVVDLFDPGGKIRDAILQSTISFTKEALEIVAVRQEGQLEFKAKKNTLSAFPSQIDSRIQAYVPAQMEDQPFYTELIKQKDRDAVADLFAKSFDKRFIENTAGVPITVNPVPGFTRLNFRRAPNDESAIVFNRIPDNSDVLLDCRNGQCTNEYVAATIYQKGVRKNPTRVYLKADAALLSPVESQKIKVSFDGDNVQFSSDQAELLKTQLSALENVQKILLWLPPDGSDSKKYLRNVMRERSLKDIIKKQGLLDPAVIADIHSTTLSTSVDGEHTAYIEVFP